MSRNDTFRTEAGVSRRRLRVWLYCVALLVGVVAAAVALLVPMTAAGHRLRDTNRKDAALRQFAQLRTSLADFQLFLDPNVLAPRSLSALSTDLAKAAQLAQTVDSQTREAARALAADGLPTTATQLLSANETFAKALSELAPLAAGRPLSQSGGLVVTERAAFAKVWSLTGSARDELQASRNSSYSAGDRLLRLQRTLTWIVLGLTTLGILAAGLLFGQRAHRRERRDRRISERQTFGNDLHEAFEMASTELDAYVIARRGLQAAVPTLNVQMLLADSSRAHLHEVLNTEVEPAASSRCAVPSPAECPATVRGHTLVFPSSRALNACPYLQDRPEGERSAVCVPISITGKTVGVTHATGPDRVTPSSEAINYLELTSRRTSDRIAMLRAFAETETQARTDPLTGLLNRRSLENRVRQIESAGQPYAVGYGDLDHFKQLNDTHGHQAGDRALRLFARVLRESVRPDDLVARYGGEEFVIVFPGVDVDAATRVLERVRERLSLALITGQVAPFTVSFGVALSQGIGSFEDVVATADTALLAAKAQGRDRVLVADALS